MKEKVARRLLLEENILGALERNEFAVYYQPKISFVDKSVVGFEALLRWNSKKLGLVSPVEFISVAEGNGKIITIGKFVIEQALKHTALWQSSTGIPLNIAVNISPVQFNDSGLVDYVNRMLMLSGLNSGCLEVEITEGVLMSGHSHIKDSLIELKMSGIKIAMDDFGTGYSSLSYLRNYPFDTLKIDREFIRDITASNSDGRLAKATIAIAKSLELNVVAEGIETEEQYKILQEFGCDQAQGFLLGKPMPAKDVITFLESSFLLKNKQ